MAAAGATEGVVAGRAGRDRTGRAGRKALRTLAVVLAAPLIAGLLAGCGSSLVKSALVAHTVQEDAHNAYLVMNIARAHERMPMHFTQVNSVRVAPGGLGLGVFSLELDVPFGAAAQPAYRLSPAIQGASAVDSVSLTSQEFFRGITSPVEPSLLAYFLDQGWPQSLVLHLFVRAIEFYDAEGNTHHRVENTPFGASFRDFQAIVADAAQCELTQSGKTRYAFVSGILPAGEATDVKAIAAAKTAGLELVAVNADGTIDDSDRSPLRRLAIVSSDTLLAIAAAPGRPDSPCTRGFLDPTTGRRVASLVAAKTRASGHDGRAAGTEDSGFKDVGLVLRSPEAMIYYLGEIARYQNGRRAGGETRLATIPIDSERQAVLFRLVCCESLRDAAIAVDYRAKTFSVPRFAVDPATGLEDRSLQALSLLSLVFALQNKATEAPFIRNVRVVP